MFKKILVACCLAALLAFAAGCDNEGPAEKAGKKVDESVEQMQEKTHEMSEEAMEKAQELSDKAREAIDDTMESTK